MPRLGPKLHFVGLWWVERWSMNSNIRRCKFAAAGTVWLGYRAAASKPESCWALFFRFFSCWAQVRLNSFHCAVLWMFCMVDCGHVCDVEEYVTSPAITSVCFCLTRRSVPVKYRPRNCGQVTGHCRWRRQCLDRERWMRDSIIDSCVFKSR
jgi:hypothetical protein